MASSVLMAAAPGRRASSSAPRSHGVRTPERPQLRPVLAVVVAQAGQAVSAWACRSAPGPGTGVHAASAVVGAGDGGVRSSARRGRRPATRRLQVVVAGQPTGGSAPVIVTAAGLRIEPRPGRP